MCGCTYCHLFNNLKLAMDVKLNELSLMINLAFKISHEVVYTFSRGN